MVEMWCKEKDQEGYMNYKIVNPFPNKPRFLRVCSTSLLKTLGKGEIAHIEQFISIKDEIVDCNFFQFGRV